jgi:hypothetical protein
MNRLKGMSAARVWRLFKKIVNGRILVDLFPVWSFPVLQKRYQAYVKGLAAKGLPFVLRIEYGGLGDHLVWCAFPEALFKKYGVKTQISLHSAFNSDEIKDFVWGTNPFVSFSGDSGRSFSVLRSNKYENYNQILLALFGLDGPLFSLHYRPSARSEVSGKVICDLTVGRSSGYNAYGTQGFRDAVLGYLKNNFKKEDLLLLDPVSPYPDKRLMNYTKEQLGAATIPVGSLRELTDLLCSAQGRVLLDSGAKSLAGAYGKPSTVLVRGFVNTYFGYPGNKYMFI